MFVLFGGGNVNVCFKFILFQYIFNMSGSLGININNFDDVYFYDGGSDDWMGKDDGICVVFVFIFQ